MVNRIQGATEGIITQCIAFDMANLYNFLSSRRTNRSIFPPSFFHCKVYMYSK